MRIAKLADTIAAKGSNVLVPDVCSILDIIRAPIRQKVNIARTAARIDREITDGSLPFLIVLPSVFGQEWSDNVNTVRESLEKELEKHWALSRDVSSIIKVIKGSDVSPFDIRTFNLPSELEALCERIVAGKQTIDRSDPIARKASERVIACRAPARKGKQELKDCLVFEEFLALGIALRQRRFEGELVFVSSNTTDYCDPSGPLSEIRSDLATIRAEYATDLVHGYYIAAGSTP